MRGILDVLPKSTQSKGLTARQTFFIAKVREFQAAKGRMPNITEISRVLNCTTENSRQIWKKLLRDGRLEPPFRKWKGEPVILEKFFASTDKVYTVQEVSEQVKYSTDFIKSWLNDHPSFADRVFISALDKRREENIAKCVKIHEELTARHGRLPTIPEFCAALNVTYGNVFRILSKNKGRLNLTFLDRRFSSENAALGAKTMTRAKFDALYDDYISKHKEKPTRSVFARFAGTSFTTVSSFVMRYKLHDKFYTCYQGNMRYTKENIIKLIDSFSSENGRLPTIRELSVILGVSVTTVTRYKRKFGFDVCYSTRQSKYTLRKKRPPIPPLGTSAFLHCLW